VKLGRTGLEVGRLGMAASYGVPMAAFERGVNYLYWGTLRRDAFAQAIRNLAPRRDRMVVVVQSYSRVAGLVGWSLERALSKLRLDQTDILLARHLALSTHHRPLAAQLASDERFGALHVRYNAEHPGAERDVFPLLPAINRPGIVSFTATLPPVVRSKSTT